MMCLDMAKICSHNRFDKICPLVWADIPIINSFIRGTSNEFTLIKRGLITCYEVKTLRFALNLIEPVGD